MADGLLGGFLPYIYSRADALKRTLGDIVSNPMASAEQSINYANDRARRLNQQLSQVPKGIAGLSSPEFQNLSNLYAEAYNPAGIFIGSRSKIWNKANAEKFLSLEEQGISPIEIWKKTGTFRTPDGILKQEIPDNLARLRADFNAAIANKANNYKSGIEGEIGGMLQHSELFKAYPDLLQNLRYTAIKQPDWLPESAAGAQYSKTIGGKEKISTSTKTEEDALSKLMHELQHAVQTREGWQSGGLESQFRDTPNMTAFQQYQALPGEVEARAVQARRTMTPEQRKEIFPLVNYELPIGSASTFTDPFGNTIGSSIR
jgi:hypothetical protein